jgi:hypothetical protein
LVGTYSTVSYICGSYENRYVGQGFEMTAARHSGGGCEVPLFTFYVLSLCAWAGILFMLCNYRMVPPSRDIVVVIATGYELDDEGVWISSPKSVKNFSSAYRPDRLCGQPAYCPTGIGGLFLHDKTAEA